MSEKIGQDAAKGLGIRVIISGSFSVRFFAAIYFQQYGPVCF
jgi:hypothetical protein